MTRQELRELKAKARYAVQKGDRNTAFVVCEKIVAHDLFIGESPNARSTGTPKSIRTKYPASYEGCGLDIPYGTEVMWVDNKGCWHHDCWEQRLGT